MNTESCREGCRQFVEKLPGVPEPHGNTVKEIVVKFTVQEYFDIVHCFIQGVKKLRLKRFRNDRGGKNKHVFYLTKLWFMHR